MQIKIIKPKVIILLIKLEWLNIYICFPGGGVFPIISSLTNKHLSIIHETRRALLYISLIGNMNEQIINNIPNGINIHIDIKYIRILRNACIM